MSLDVTGLTHGVPSAKGPSHSHALTPRAFEMKCDLWVLFCVREVSMKKVPVWCAAAGLFVGTVTLAAFAAPAVLERFSLGPFKDKAPFGPLDPLSQPHPRSERLTSANGRLTVSRFEFVPQESVPTGGGTIAHQRFFGRVTPGIQDALAAQPLPSLVRQPFLVPHALATMPPTTARGTIRALQRELKRAGCYTGKIDGAWGPVSRDAALMFVQSAGLTLPSDKPYQAILMQSRQRVAPACTDTAPTAKERRGPETPAGPIRSATSLQGPDIVAREADSRGGDTPQNPSFSKKFSDAPVRVSSWRSRHISGQ